MDKKLKIAFFGSSLVSAYWNGAATYYRGIIKGLSRLGYQITFFEPDAYERQLHRDIPDPDYAKIIVYENQPAGVQSVIDDAAQFDVVIKASGVGVFDELLEEQVLIKKKNNQLVIFWDVDAPATLERIEKNPADHFRSLVSQYDLILTYGGGQPVIDAYRQLGAKQCIPVYNALDPETHYRIDSEDRFKCDLAFLGNRLPDRESRVDEFFFQTAVRLPNQKFKLGGSGWADKSMPPNVEYLGHVYTKDHNVLNSSPKAVLNISRESMATMGFSPATRIFEAAGAGACIITDYWQGIENFFDPGNEILVARSGAEVADLLDGLTAETAKKIGSLARKRVLEFHTYTHRALEVDKLFEKNYQPVNSIEA